MVIAPTATSQLPTQALRPAAGASRPSAEDEAYFSELLGYSLDRLSQEPQLLQAEQERLSTQLSSLAQAHAGIFVACDEHSATLRSRLGEASSALKDLETSLPKLQECAETFKQKTAHVFAARRAHSSLVTHQALLLDLLELPQLMETCVRSGSFEEALDLKSFVHKLQLLHGDLDLIQRLVADCDKVSRAARRALLARLSKECSLPECLQAVSHLRRLGLSDEQTLRSDFIRCRDVWIAGLIADLAMQAGAPAQGASGEAPRPRLAHSNASAVAASGAAYDFLKRLADVYRLHVSDVVMQYRALFGDEVSRQEDAPGAVLWEWALMRGSTYVAAVEAAVGDVRDASALASVLDHAMHCGASLARVGLDFRPLLVSVFERAFVDLFENGIAAADEALRVSLADGFVWSLPRQDKAKGVDEGADKGATGHVTSVVALSPLLSFPPLALYLNGLLAALNELRHCTAPSLQLPCTQALRASLERAVEVVVVSIAAAQGEAAAGGRAGAAAFARLLLPHVAACVDVLFPPAGGAELRVRELGAPLLRVPEADEEQA